MPHISIATWNINSVRVRADHIARFVSEHQPDVLCLQEIKCRNEEFPSKAFSSMGLRYVNVIGQKGSHGVAIASKHPLQVIQAPTLCPRSEARVAAVAVKGITIHNLYVPAGGEEPDPVGNDKFAHKLEVLARMKAHYAAAPKGRPTLLVGDLNIAPGEHDVWSHKQLLNVVSHTPVETEGLEAVRAAGDFVDVARALKPDPEKLYSWWSYRGDWKTANRGRRLDHIWATPGLAERCDRIEFIGAPRGWDRPSDHIPVMARFSI
ncbi:MAG: exodeoxyribonuclease III [Hyphomonadaceae bacterium]|nr:exodeoxyribonuclease III [Hyphomonadaceae bacterium]